MTQCVQCQIELQKDQKFCSECGTPVSNKKVCPHCQTECDITCKFCSQCGGNFQAVPQVPVQPKVDSKGFEAIKKHVSILFADTKGSTTAISQLDAEDARNT